MPVGYGDGWARAYAPAAQALVRGVTRAARGQQSRWTRVMADVTDVGDVGLDDEFVLIGGQNGAQIVPS